MICPKCNELIRVEERDPNGHYARFEVCKCERKEVKAPKIKKQEENDGD